MTMTCEQACQIAISPQGKPEDETRAAAEHITQCVPCVKWTRMADYEIDPLMSRYLADCARAREHM